MRVFLAGLCLLIASFTYADTLRVVSVAPVVTEILYLLGAESQLVGNTTSCTYPKAAMKIAKVGDFITPSLERIVALHPNLIIGMGNNASPQVSKLREWGIKTMILDVPETFNGVYDLIFRVGQMLGKSQQAARVLTDLKKRVGELERTKPSRLVPTLMLIWTPPTMAVGPKTFISQMLSVAGYRNIVTDETVQFPKINAEAILAGDPAVIISGDPRLVGVIRSQGWFQSLDAQHPLHLISDIDPDLLLRPGPRFVEGIRQLRARLK